MNIVCIVQARTGSTRLPSKVLKKICEKTVLEHVIDRLKKVKNIDQIIIATTTKKQDDIIVEIAKKYSVGYFRGSEENVLSRYYYAAQENSADVVVRITSDCPLIDSEITEKIIQYYVDNNSKYDYVSNTIDRTYPRGLDTEVFGFNVLERAFNEVKSERDREHVTPYIWDNPKIFKIYQYKNKVNYSNLRWTLDTIDDFKLINRIYNELYYDKGSQFCMKDILNLYKKYPELTNINKNVYQKIV